MIVRRWNESTEFVADFVTTAGAVSGDCLPMLTKMAPRNVMPSLFMYAPVKGGYSSTVLQFYSPFSFSFILTPSPCF